MTMKLFSVTIAAMMAASASAFAPSSASRQVRTSLNDMPPRLYDSMVDKSKRSASVPFLPLAKSLDGSYVGDVGFDPFYLSSIPKNFAGFIQPPSWEETEGIDTLYWMREAELKHCRVAMLAWFGWLATDGAFGITLRFPGEIYQNIPNAYSAHDILVEQGSMQFLLLVVGVLEFCTGAALVQVSKGELDREAGDFKLDPLRFLVGKSKDQVDRMKLREINNGRLAMLAFGAVSTQAALGEASQSFPYF